MKKTFRLISVQLWAALSDMLAIGKVRRKKPTMLYVGLILFTVLMSAFSFFYSYMIGAGLKMFYSLDLLPAIMVSAACLLTLMTTIFKVKGTIFGFRDYDLLMSLPVSTASVVACRLIILYAFNILFTVILILPMTIAYGILAAPGISFYIMSLILMFIIPLVPIVAASVIGTVIAYIASRFRFNNALNILFSIFLFLTFFGMSFSFNGDGQELVDIGKALTDRVYSLYPLARFYTTAVISHDLLSFILFIIISLFAFVLYVVVVRLLFKRINTLIMTGRSKSNYKLGELKTGSPFKALYFKELKRFFSSTIYVMNTGIGIVLLTIAAIAGFFVDIETVMGGEQSFSLIKDNVVIYLIFCIMLSCTTMASISLEGKNLWIIKSLPVTPMTVFRSKIAVNLTICSPALLDVVLFGIMLNISIGKIILLLLITAACSVFIAMFGLFINLLLPNLTWTSEVVAVKQSASTMVTIFSGFGFAALLFLFVLLIPSVTLAYLAYFLLLCVMIIVLNFILNSYGVRRYYSL